VNAFALLAPVLRPETASVFEMASSPMRRRSARDCRPKEANAIV